MTTSSFTFVLVGPHGAGKTTVGNLLARAMNVPFHPEIGRILAADPRFRKPGTTAALPQSAFDEAVFAEEFARDVAHGGAGRVVETWHPGNLAYATRRSPAVAANCLAGIREACGKRTVVIPVVASREVLSARQTEPGPFDFFQAVGQDAIRWALALGLRIAPPVNTSAGEPRLALMAALRSLRALDIQVPAIRPQPAMELC